jgi:hypothetical protein
VVLKSAFGGQISRDWVKGYLTESPALPFKALAGFLNQKKAVVGLEGLEPPA